MNKVETQQQIKLDVSNLFSNGYLDGKCFYMYRFGKIPQENYIGGVDGEKTFNSCRKEFADMILEAYNYQNAFDGKKKFRFNESYLLLNNDFLLEFGNGYLDIYHGGTDPEFLEKLSAIAHVNKERQRKQPLEINLVSRSRNGGLELRDLEIKRTKLDLDLFYEDDFKDVNDIICKRLKSKNDKGIVLLHGLPGTGKTTYLRYLIGKIKKRILFLSPSLAHDIMNPDFVQLLVSNPNSVIIIEDAENVIMDRKLSGNAAVSNLLNISDGLLADFLNVQLVCTFNSSLTMVDTALLRKGRLIAKYEFGKLSVGKAQRLSNHFGNSTIINQPMTIAEIANQKDIEFKTAQKQPIGFRRYVEDEILV